MELTNEQRWAEVADRIVHLCGGSDDVTRILIETVLRLPQKVGEYALDRCLFISVGVGGEAAPGMCLPGSYLPQEGGRRLRNLWLIVLSEDVPPEDAHGIVAHEIAHAWLRHHPSIRLEDTIEVAIKQEIDAVKLTRQWGFMGIGTDFDENVPCRVLGQRSAFSGISGDRTGGQATTTDGAGREGGGLARSQGEPSGGSPVP